MKNHLKLNNKKINNLIKKQSKDVNRHIINEDTQMASKHMTKSSIPRTTRDTQIQTTRYYYKCIRLAKLKNTDNTKSWKVSVEQLKFSFVAGGNVKMVQPLYKTILNHTI